MPTRLPCLVLALLLLFARPDCKASGETTDSASTATARLIGITAELQELQSQPPASSSDPTQQWKALALHQRIDERIMSVQLEADATVASIDNEIARASEVRGYLADKRDRHVTRANLLSALVGGGLGATSAGLQLSSKQLNATVATGVAGGAISTSLAVYGIIAQHGSALILDAESNMLAQFFGRPALETSHYPAVIWQFLNEVAPSDPDHLIRRERLIRTWVELKRLDAPDSPSGKRKIDHVTSMAAQSLALTIDDLDDRIAMLQDVRAKLSYLKRDLAALLRSLPPLNKP